MRESPFLPGNVVRRKTSKDLYIVTDTNDKTTIMIPFDDTNCHIHAQNKKSYRQENCGCYIDQRCPDPSCKTCNGTGRVTVQNCYIGDYAYVADTTKDFIVDKLTSFEF